MWRARSRLLKGVAGLLVLAGCLWATTARAQSPIEPEPLPRFVESECPFVPPWTLSARCGRLLVPEVRSEPAAAMLELHVVILKAGAPHDEGAQSGAARQTLPGKVVALQPDPVLVLPGGPGSGALDLRYHFYPLALRLTRDVILLDPRGSGASLPSLDCFEVDAPDELLPDVAAAYAACAARLQAEGRILDAYAATHQVDDVADLARALGLPSLNIYATSYGTRVAVLLAERYPGLVRSMVLDGVLPVSVNALLEEPLHMWAAFRRMAADCAADPACNAAWPALEARLLALVDRYNRTPLADDLGYGSGDEILRLLTDELLLRGGALLPPLITALYEEDFARACALRPPAKGCFFSVPPAAGDSPHEAWGAAAGIQEGTPDGDGRALFAHPNDPTGPNAERLTWLMRQLEARTPQELFALLDAMALVDIHALLNAYHPAPHDRFSEGAFACVMCSEEAPFYTTADVEAIAARIPAQLGDLPVQRAADVAALCAQWPVAPVSPAAKVTQVLDTPALLLAGTHDPVTPPAWAWRAAAYLEESRVVLFAGRGHSVLAGAPAPGDDCLDALLAAFYADPSGYRLPACLSRLAARPTLTQK